MDASRDHSRSTTPPSGRQASFRTTSPKPKRGFGSSTGRFDNPGCQSDAQREAKAEERLEAMFAEPAEEGAQVRAEGGAEAVMDQTGTLNLGVDALQARPA